MEQAAIVLILSLFLQAAILVALIVLGVTIWKYASPKFRASRENDTPRS